MTYHFSALNAHGAGFAECSRPKIHVANTMEKYTVVGRLGVVVVVQLAVVVLLPFSSLENWCDLQNILVRMLVDAIQMLVLA